TDDADRLYARARVLGLDRSDLVVRRILVQKMRLLAARTGERPPSDADLEAFYADHRNEYRPPDRVTFWHIFVHGGTDAEGLLAHVRGPAPASARRPAEASPAP